MCLNDCLFLSNALRGAQPYESLAFDSRGNQ